MFLKKPFVVLNLANTHSDKISTLTPQVLLKRKMWLLTTMVNGSGVEKDLSVIKLHTRKHLWNPEAQIPKQVLTDATKKSNNNQTVIFGISVIVKDNDYCRCYTSNHMPVLWVVSWEKTKHKHDIRNQFSAFVNKNFGFFYII